MNAESLTKKNVLLMAAALLAVGFSMISVTRSCARSGSPHDELTDGLGTRMGAVVARSIGKKVVVLDYPSGSSKLLDSQKQQFLKALGRNGVKVQEVLILDIPPEAGSRYLRPEEFGITVEQYAEAARAFPDVDAIVSIAGALNATPQSLDMIPQDAPPLVITYSQRPQQGIEELMERGFLQMVIQPLPSHQLSGKGKPESPEQWLADYFDVITVDDHVEP